MDQSEKVVCEYVTSYQTILSDEEIINLKVRKFELNKHYLTAEQTTKLIRIIESETLEILILSYCTMEDILMKRLIKKLHPIILWF